MRRRMLGEQSLTLITRAAGSYIDGQWVEGSESRSSFRGAIQPLSVGTAQGAREVMQVPEGWRTTARWKLYTHAKLNVELPGTSQSGDIIEWADGSTGRLHRLLVVGITNHKTTPRRLRLLHFKYFMHEESIAEEPK